MSDGGGFGCRTTHWGLCSQDLSGDVGDEVLEGLGEWMIKAFEESATEYRGEIGSICFT